MDYIALSKEVSYALRHAPEKYGLVLDEQGFVPIDQLLSALNKEGRYGRPVTEDDLAEMIARSAKARHEMRDGKIRALYGHSASKHVVKERTTPPPTLYHGTARRFLDAIMAEGLKPMSRQYVHLSVDIETAVSVGMRRDSHPVVLVVDAATASRDGINFYVGNDKVWLADPIPARYLSVLRRGN
ncbi:MAG: RNA 2'-phosphotransferase [Tractidigestivibacter sp.]|jgi:putative RNA 2'-phosphotransferase|uniref:RNA 2'-phosphotransferase n=1 Tax=Tractidigestivibacter sp. TaxID=2847320 RepID=UPI003D8C00FB